MYEPYWHVKSCDNVFLLMSYLVCVYVCVRVTTCPWHGLLLHTISLSHSFSFTDTHTHTHTHTYTHAHSDWHDYKGENFLQDRSIWRRSNNNNTTTLFQCDPFQYFNPYFSIFLAKLYCISLGLSINEVTFLRKVSVKKCQSYKMFRCLNKR